MHTVCIIVYTVISSLKMQKWAESTILEKLDPAQCCLTPRNFMMICFRENAASCIADPDSALSCTMRSFPDICVYTDCVN